MMTMQYIEQIETERNHVLAVVNAVRSWRNAERAYALHHLTTGKKDEVLQEEIDMCARQMRIAFDRFESEANAWQSK